MNKTELRRTFSRQRATYTSGQLYHLGEAVTQQVVLHHLLDAFSVIHCFVGSVEKGEIGTETLIRRILQDKKKLILPRICGADSLEHIVTTDIDHLKKNSWGIDEPPPGNTVKPEEIELVFIPALAADYQGHRIGYGKGFYDRFLSQCPAHKVIIVPEAALVDTIYPEAHDIPAHTIVTEKKVWHISKEK
ncbi:5-formyltetrahydrofolate cyclo-ligase [Balneolaceae bacterium ANBcel3]|nr:5-formyltetrahydrofolate cyclo-ligase [Balneolaceae bacterium ANBcel3]